MPRAKAAALRARNRRFATGRVLLLGFVEAPQSTIDLRRTALPSRLTSVRTMPQRTSGMVAMFCSAVVSQKLQSTRNAHAN
jgi:hypothetical protein